MKLYEEELKKLFKCICESTPDAVINIDANGKILFWNKGAERIFGYSPREVIGKPLTMVMPKRFHNAFKKGLKRTVLTGKSKIIGKTIEYPITKKDGNEIPTAMTFSSCKTKYGIVFTAIVRDISNQKTLENELRKQKEKFENYLNIVRNIIVALNADGEIILINKKGYEILGYKEGQLIGKDWFKTCIPKENREEVRNIFKKCIQGKIKLAEFYENPIITKDGKKRIIRWHNSLLKDEKGKIIGTISAGEDVTELKTSEQKFKNLFELAGDPIIILDKKGIIVDINKKTKELFGYTKEELLGKKFTDAGILTRKSRLIALKKFLKRMAGFEVKPYEIEVIKKNGEKIIGEINAATIRGDGVVYDMVIIRDITERKKIEDELRKRNEELEKISKLAIGRELKMVELKKRIKELENKLKECKKLKEGRR